jgi:enterochelin esterase family protein
VRLTLPHLHSEITATLWAPAGAGDRVLVAHDGPDYDTYGELSRFLAASIAAGRIPPCRLLLLPAEDRLEWYSASPAYSRSLAVDLLPQVADGPVVGAGASLGALAMLHAQRTWPGTFAGLFLQSGSFFVPRFDDHESGFARYQRIIRFVGGVLRSRAAGETLPVAMTCGAEEENVHNNRLMASALTAQGYAARLDEVPDLHNYTSWRDAFDPHLTRLLARLWSPR